MRFSCFSKRFCLVLLATGTACGDSTGPSSRWNGIWDLTTTLQAYVVEVGCPQYEYCEVEYPAPAGSLQGTLVLHVTPTDTSASARIVGEFCDALSSAGCVHSGPPKAASLTGTLET